jgi:hypothetical protein
MEALPEFALELEREERMLSFDIVRAPTHTCVTAGLRGGVLLEASRRSIVGLDAVSHRNISPGPLIPTGRYGRERTF